jgi:MoaA/NifB/PqqE/SkfB family radical SAM enzyme
MISSIYKFLPSFLQTAAVEVHRDLRLVMYEFKRKKLMQKCTAISPLVYDEFNKSRRYGPLTKICYAPYTSMFFSRSGFVSPCYASYSEKSSRIDNSSLHDIWFNGSFADIRNQHAVCNFNASCKFCEDILYAGSYKSALINKYEHYAFSKSNYPVIMEFELSNKCNLACIMCDSNLSSGIEAENCDTVSGNQFYGNDFFEQLREFIPHLQLAEFTGGDPFMIEEYYLIWDMIAELNPKCNILITTNANTMNPKIEKLLETHKNISFNISIDSLVPDNYESIRRNGNFEFAQKNIQKFVDYSRRNKTDVNILVCPMTVNNHELADFVDYANNLGICVYYHTVVKPKELSLKYLDSESLEKLADSIEIRQFPEETKNHRTNRANLDNLIKLLRDWADESRQKESQKEKPDYLIQYAEAVDLLNIRVNEIKPDLLNKFGELLSHIDEMPNKQIVVNKLILVSDEEFFNYLADKSVLELSSLCREIQQK